MQLTFLKPLYARPGPWATAYLDASHDTEDAQQRIDLRWRAARADLESQGADPATIDAMEGALAGQPPMTGEGGLAIFASAGGDASVHPFPGVLPQPLIEVGPLPHVTPLLAMRGERVPWIRVLVNRTGADLDATTDGFVDLHQRVKGSHTYPMRRTGNGGWSQPRYDRAAMSTWDRNAVEVAEAVAELATAIGAEVIVVAGEPQARSMLLDRLPVRWKAVTVPTEAGARAAGADPEPLDEATINAVTERVDAQMADLLDRYHTQLAHGGAVTGMPEVVGALQQARVDTMVVAGEIPPDRRLWIGPEPTLLFESAADARSAGVESPEEVSAGAAITRALAGTDAAILYAQPGEAKLDGELGALLR